MTTTPPPGPGPSSLQGGFPSSTILKPHRASILDYKARHGLPVTILV